MLAQLFLTPSGMMLEAAAAVGGAVPVAAVPQESSPFFTSAAGLVSSLTCVSQAGDSVVGTEIS